MRVLESQLTGDQHEIEMPSGREREMLAAFGCTAQETLTVPRRSYSVSPPPFAAGSSGIRRVHIGMQCDSAEDVCSAFSQKGAVGESLIAQAVYLIVKGYAEKLDVLIAPHPICAAPSPKPTAAGRASSRSRRRSATNRF